MASSINLLAPVIAIALLVRANHAEDNTTIVYIYNHIEPKAILEVVCRSKDVEDLWSGGLQPWTWWSFTLTPNERTSYHCTFRWDSGDQFHDFTIYDQKRDGGLCPRDSIIKCGWVLKAGGPCLELSEYDKCYPWMDVGIWR